MKSHYDELEKLRVILVELEKLYHDDALTPKRIAIAQKRLDDLAVKLQRDESLGSGRFLLYETQALLHDAAGDIVNARKFANEAAEVKGDEELVTGTVRELISKGGQNETLDTKKITGWLMIFAIMMVVTPFYHIYNFFDSLNTVSSLPASYGSLATLVSIEAFISLCIAIAYFVLWSLFAKRKRAARTFAISLFASIIAYSVIDMVVAAGVLDGLIDSGELGKIIGQQIWATIITTAWLLYIVNSKRVKQTFVK